MDSTVVEHSTEPPPLPASARRLLDKVFNGEELGASRNIRRINDAFCAIAEEWDGASRLTLVSSLLQTGEHLIETRGRNTPAIANAVRFVLHGLAELDGGTPAEVQAFVARRRDEYNARSLACVARIARYGANVLRESRTVLTFDYSSTMLAILEKLAEQGRQVRLIVPESRALDGGRPIAAQATACGHLVRFIPDMAFASYMAELDAVLIGAETIFATGECWNTIGSYPVAVLAARYRVPFYVATELMKIDPQSFQGIRRAIAPHAYAALYDYPASFSDPDNVSVVAPELDTVPAQCITGYITERGVLLPEHLRPETRQFLDSIGSPVPHE
jgi:ribose 1,5-bisphosphate isomerase